MNKYKNKKEWLAAQKKYADWFPDDRFEVDYQARAVVGQLISELEKAWSALEFYAGMKAVCGHDDGSWCNHCPDAGRRARQALGKEAE